MATPPQLSPFIIGLLDTSARSDEEWATSLGISISEIVKWRRGFGFPEDEVMKKVLDECERMKESPNCPRLSAAIDAFWFTIERLERSKSTGQLGFFMGESVVQRFTRFTNGDPIGGIMKDIDRIPPRRRKEFLNAVLGLFNQFASGSR